MCKYNRVLVRSFSCDDRELLHFLLHSIKAVLEIEVEYIGDVPLPYHAYEPSRHQFLAKKFLDQLLFDREKEGDIVLGITSVDLYEPGLNFVFGVASPAHSAGVISTARLHNSFYGQPESKNTFLERCLKEAIHEIGHVLGLGHCANQTCVMHFSNSIRDTDIKSHLFCSACQAQADKVLCKKQVDN